MADRMNDEGAGLKARNAWHIANLIRSQSSPYRRHPEIAQDRLFWQAMSTLATTPATKDPDAAARREQFIEQWKPLIDNYAAVITTDPEIRDDAALTAATEQINTLLRTVTQDPAFNTNASRNKRKHDNTTDPDRNVRHREDAPHSADGHVANPGPAPPRAKNPDSSTPQSQNLPDNDQGTGTTAVKVESAVNDPSSAGLSVEAVTAQLHQIHDAQLADGADLGIDTVRAALDTLDPVSRRELEQHAAGILQSHLKSAFAFHTGDTPANPLLATMRDRITYELAGRPTTATTTGTTGTPVITAVPEPDSRTWRNADELAADFAATPGTGARTGTGLLGAGRKKTKTPAPTSVAAGKAPTGTTKNTATPAAATAGTAAPDTPDAPDTLWDSIKHGRTPTADEIRHQFMKTDLRDHIINGEVWGGKIRGAHKTLRGNHLTASPDGTLVIKPGSQSTPTPNGVYTATVQDLHATTRDQGNITEDKPGNPFFPDHLTQEQILRSVAEAFANAAATDPELRKATAETRWEGHDTHNNRIARLLPPLPHPPPHLRLPHHPPTRHHHQNQPLDHPRRHHQNPRRHPHRQRRRQSRRRDRPPARPARQRQGHPHRPQHPARPRLHLRRRRHNHPRTGRHHRPEHRPRRRRRTALRRHHTHPVPAHPAHTQKRHHPLDKPARRHHPLDRPARQRPRPRHQNHHRHPHHPRPPRPHHRPHQRPPPPRTPHHHQPPRTQRLHRPHRTTRPTRPLPPPQPHHRH